jgi:hypothetical protein
MTIRRPFVKIDLNYVITAWVIDGNPDEEHYLLTATLLALARHPLLPSTRGRFLPEDAKIDVSFLPEPLRNQPSLIPIMVAEPEALVNPADVWSALDNELRPCITCTTTLALDPFVPIEVPMPSGRDISVTPRGESVEPRIKRPSYGIKGVIRSEEPLQNMRLILLDRGLNGRGLFVPLIPNESLTEREFELPQLRYGDYNLEVSATNQAPIGFEIALPTKELEKEEQKGGISFNIKIEEQPD